MSQVSPNFGRNVYEPVIVADDDPVTVPENVQGLRRGATGLIVLSTLIAFVAPPIGAGGIIWGLLWLLATKPATVTTHAMASDCHRGDRVGGCGWYVVTINEDANGNAHDSQDYHEYDEAACGSRLASPILIAIDPSMMLEREGWQGGDEQEVKWLAQIFRSFADWLEENATDVLDRKNLTVDLLSIMAAKGIDMDVWGDALK